MKKAFNQHNKLVDIIESTKDDTYTCPVCKEILTRNFGVSRQFFSHPNEKGNDCELKLGIMMKDKSGVYGDSEIDILRNEYYEKTFDDVKIELSDYMSEEGYYLTQEQKDIIFAEEDRIKIAALAGCVDCDTEYFNGNGWVKISDYKYGDKVLQFTNEWKAELVNPLEYIKLSCDKMTRYKTKYGIDMVLSDEHNVLYIDTSHNHHNYWKNVNLLKIKESEMRARHIKNKSGFTGKFLTTFDYDGNYSTGLSENELRLTVAIMADGAYNTKTNWCRMNLKKDYKKDRLRWLLNECNIEFNENKWNNTDDKYINICFYSPLKLKHFPKEWYDLNKCEREIIFDEISHWDGDNGIGNRGIRYRTSCKEDADFIQFVVSSLGKRLTINIDNSKPIGEKYILSTNGKEYTRKSILYTLNVVNGNNIIGIGGQTDTNNKLNVISEYITTDGYKYCFTVPSGMLVLRRNNKIFVTGNSAKTSTLYYYAKEHPFKRILYLVYNKSMVDACSSTFGKLRNTEVRTIHSLGYYYCGKFYKNKLTFNYSTVDVIKDLNLNWNKDMEIAVKVNEMIKEYTLTDAIEFSDIDMFKDKDGNTTDEREEIISLCIKLWDLKKEYKNSIKITHDDYLKMFHLEKKQLNNKYDIIMLDECLPKSQLIKTIIGNVSIKQLYDWYIEGSPLPLVLSYNIYTDTFEYKKITWAKKSENRQLLEISTNINKLQCTENHKILTHRGYVRADNLIPGRDMLILDGVNQYAYNYVKYIKTIHSEDVYDIEVKDNHNFVTVRENNDIGIVVHNCQDSSTLVLDILKSSNVKGIVIVGDQYQCLTEGTLISTPNGKVKIEDISIDDEINVACGFSEKTVGKVESISKNKISEKLVRITTENGNIIEGTTNHMIFGKIDGYIVGKGKHYIYIMFKKGYGYRIGVTSSLRKVNGVDTNGFMARINAERGDKLWIIKVCEDMEEAIYYESYYSYKYGIPQTVFTSDNTKVITQETIDKLYNNIDTYSRIDKLFDDLYLFKEYPHHIPQASFTGKEINKEKERLKISFTMFGRNSISRKSGYSSEKIFYLHPHELYVNTTNTDYAECSSRYISTNIKRSTSSGNEYFSGRKSHTLYDYCWDIMNNIINDMKSIGYDVDPNIKARLTDNKFDLIPLTNVIEGMIIPVETENGIINEKIIKIERFNYEGHVYDLNVPYYRNYIANNIVVHNCLYGWRKATNIMPMFEGKEYKLTTSFRISQNTANIANMIIKDICKVDINMKGFNTNQKIVTEIDKSKPYVCLCRTNAYIFGETVDVITTNPNAKLYYESGFQSYAFNNILDGWYFYKGQKVNNPLFNKFKDFSKLLDYAKRISDLELLAINRMIEKYSISIPQIISNIKKNVTTNRDLASVIFSTVHRAKGSTQNLPVYIADDIFDIETVFRKEYIDTEKEEDFDIKNYEDESFIAYVAISRAYNNLYLPDKIKNYLIMRYNFYKDN